MSEHRALDRPKFHPVAEVLRPGGEVVEWSRPPAPVPGRHHRRQVVEETTHRRVITETVRDAGSAPAREDASGTAFSRFIEALAVLAGLVVLIASAVVTVVLAWQGDAAWAAAMVIGMGFFTWSLWR